MWVVEVQNRVDQAWHPKRTGDGTFAAFGDWKSAETYCTFCERTSPDRTFRVAEYVRKA